MSGAEQKSRREEPLKTQILPSKWAQRSAVRMFDFGTPRRWVNGGSGQGRTGSRLRLLDRLALSRNGPVSRGATGPPCSAVWRAKIYGSLDEKDVAFEWLEKSL